MKNVLLTKLKDKGAIIGIVGLGYVGLPLALRFLEVGFRVLGLDIDKAKVKSLLSGKSYIKHIDLSPIKEAIEKNMFNATSEFSSVSEADVIILCVPTPLNKHREPDLSFVINSVEMIAEFVNDFGTLHVRI